ncbi:UNVERIFIED_CONTAM: hypothetical protein RMT77_003354 [Armadillidium vulgare]
MEIYSTKAFRRKQKILVESSYSSSLQFYSEPPTGNITLKEFDELAVERLKILRAIERINLSGHAKNSEEWMQKIFEDFQKNKFFIISADKIGGTKNEDVINARRKDHLSHFILRLAYCRSEELRRWFVAQETDLFRARFVRVAKMGADFSLFLKENNLHFSQITEEELKQESVNLMMGTYNINSVDQLEDKTFFKVPFVEALELVRNRKVFLKKGFAYVPSSDLVTLVSAVFRSKLSQALTATYKALPQIENDERLYSLQDFDKRYTGSDYSQKKSASGQQITPEMLNHLSTTSFPLCMRHMHEYLNTHHHLKHGGRMQYGLFLKAAGLKLEDALKFWRSHFTKNMDVDKFEKQYAYNIRHNYGKEGKRTDYTPYSCMKIITTNVGAGDCHGCPFKHNDSNILKQKLINYQVPGDIVNEILDLTSKHHYQIACQRYFEAKHHSTIESGVNHPNQYFEESVAILHGTKTPNKAASTPNIKYQHSVLTSQSQASPNTQSQNAADISGVESMLFDDDMDDALFEAAMQTDVNS